MEFLDLFQKMLTLFLVKITILTKKKNLLLLEIHICNTVLLMY